MHTFSNKIIEPNKISLLNYNKDYSASSILKYLIEKNIFLWKNNVKIYTNIILLLIIIRSNFKIHNRINCKGFKKKKNANDIWTSLKILIN